MNTDHYVRGKEELSQDYALSGMEPMPYAIIADGCTGARYSDIGAMVLAHAARNVLGQYSNSIILNYVSFGKIVISQAEIIANILGRPKTILDATLGIVWIAGDNAYVRLYGDGIIFCVYKEKGLHWQRINFDNNMPFYLRYWVDSGSRRLYDEKVNAYTIKAKLSDGGFLEESFGYSQPIEAVQAIDEIKLIGVASDGLGALFDKESALFDDQDAFLNLDTVLGEITALRNRTGKFLVRRMRRILNQFENEGIVQGDDISVAIINI